MKGTPHCTKHRNTLRIEHRNPSAGFGKFCHSQTSACRKLEKGRIKNSGSLVKHAEANLLNPADKCNALCRRPSDDASLLGDWEAVSASLPANGQIVRAPPKNGRFPLGFPQKRNKTGQTPISTGDKSIQKAALYPWLFHLGRTLVQGWLLAKGLGSKPLILFIALWKVATKPLALENLPLARSNHSFVGWTSNSAQSQKKRHSAPKPLFVSQN